MTFKDWMLLHEKYSRYGKFGTIKNQLYQNQLNDIFENINDKGDFKMYEVRTILGEETQVAFPPSETIEDVLEQLRDDMETMPEADRWEVVRINVKDNQ